MADEAGVAGEGPGDMAAAVPLGVSSRSASEERLETALGCRLSRSVSYSVFQVRR